MTIHRIDFAIDLLGPITRVCGAVARFAPRDRTALGKPCPPSDVDDWSCLIGEFASGSTGVWEGTTLAKGYYPGNKEGHIPTQSASEGPMKSSESRRGSPLDD